MSRPHGSRNKPKVPTSADTTVAAGVATAGGGGGASGGENTPRARTREAFPKYRTARVADLVPYERNARTHSPKQIDKLCRLIKEFGWTNPMLVAGKHILAGHARREAAVKLGMVVIPVIDLSHLNAAQRRAYILADNRAALDAGWDDGLLSEELLDLKELGFDLDLTGFDPGELLNLLGDESGGGLTDPDEVPPLAEPVTVLGDVWILGRHTLHCADCRDVLPTLTDVDAVVTDPPYGVNLGDHLGAKDGRKDHVLIKGRYDSYEDTPENFVDIVVPAVRMAIEIAGRGAVFTTQNLCELPRPAALGGVYIPAAQGRHCWGYASLAPIAFYGKCPDLNKGSKATVLESNATCEKNGHPCPKPTAWMEWLLSLATRTGETALDPFAGSGTTIIAAEITGRACVGIELSPAYVDMTIRRWQAFVGAEATLEGDGRTFAAIEAARAAKPARVKARVKVSA